ncbi:hypothetical protein C8R44DRAFT_736818 [Mycena epipterygia]|nr:hypothetical protein C8R44DRAFT_736818 [Mycena epipterygia]
MHTVQKLASTPNMLVFMGSRKLAATEALTKFTFMDFSSTVVPIQFDATDAASIENAHAFIANYLRERNLAGLDVLINKRHTVNVFGTVAIKEAILPLLNGGAILNISFILGSKWRYSQKPPVSLFYPAYASSKAAINSLTVQWAFEEDQKGFGTHVVSICPGFNATNVDGYTGASDPADGCKIIVEAALEKGGRSGVFFNKKGNLPG